MEIPDLRAGAWNREQQDIARRMFVQCRAIYNGPDPMGVGLGWCQVTATLAHRDHRDQYGRVWPNPKYVASRPSVTINQQTVDKYIRNAILDLDERTHRMIRPE